MNFMKHQKVFVRTNTVNHMHIMVEGTCISHIGNQVVYKDASGNQGQTSECDVWPSKEAAEKALNIHVHVDATDPDNPKISEKNPRK